MITKICHNYNIGLATDKNNIPFNSKSELETAPIDAFRLDTSFSVDDEIPTFVCRRGRICNGAPTGLRSIVDEVFRVLLIGGRGT